MLTAPSIANVNGVTVWADDTLYYLFYLISAAPRLRTDKVGDPVISMAKYEISDEDRANDPTLPLGGGYLNFDATFAVTDEEEAAVRAEMQPRVDAEWERRRNGTKEEKESVKGTTEPPKVMFAAPSYSGGSANLVAPDSEHLVEKQVAHGVPDLMAGNIAIFAMDLTAAGASLIHQVLTDENGSDSTPFQVGMTLEFPARMPPVNIEVLAESERIYEETRKFMDGEGVDKCSTYDFEQSDINTALAEVSGLIQVNIDPGSAQVSDEVMEELRQYALDMMQQMIENNFFTEDPLDAYYPGFEDEIPPEFLQEQQDEQAASNNSKKYLKESYDKTTMDLELRLTQSSVVTLTVNPQATLQSFFAGRPPSDVARFIRSFRLGEDFFRNLDLSVRVFGEFETTSLEAVEVQLEYEGTDFDGERRKENTTFIFTEDTAQVWGVSLIGSNRRVRYRYRAKVAGQDFGPFSEFETTESNALNISIPTPGVLSREIVAGALDFDALKLHSVQVDLLYEDAELGVEPVAETLVLTKGAPADQLLREIGAEVRKPIKFKRRFVYLSGEIDEDEEFQESDSSTIYINQPFGALLEARFMPVGAGWDEVVQVTVEAFYKDPENGVDETEVIILRSHQDLRVWTVRLKDREKVDYSYRVNVSYKNGDHEEGPLTTASGSGVEPIKVREPRSTTVNVIPNRLDFTASPITEVVLTHPESGTRDTMTFDQAVPRTWTVPVRPNEPLAYSATVTHFPDGLDPLVVGPIEETDSALVLPPYRAPEAGSLSIKLMPTLLDFSKTPVVIVDLLYEDEANDVSHSKSFGFEAGASTEEWVIPVRDVHRRLYRMTTTYFVAPGNQPITSDPEFSTRSLIVLPPFQAEAG